MPDAGLQAPAVWHWSAAVQATGLAPAQAPASQVSVCVQALPSLQGAPLALAGLLQMPDAGLQVPGAEERRVGEEGRCRGSPDHSKKKVAGCVQALPSLHGAPLALAGLLQTPVAGLQAPAVWHWSAVVQVRGLALPQAPASQVSVCVQALPSLHGAPLALAGLLQTPDAGLQVP